MSIPKGYTRLELDTACKDGMDANRKHRRREIYPFATPVFQEHWLAGWMEARRLRRNELQRLRRAVKRREAAEKKGETSE
jgi:ribosome modulation factor